MEKTEEIVRVYPVDEYNQTLVNNVHPPEWVNPTPASRYNLVVIGAGTAGLITAAGAAGLGAKVALVERHLMGGDCLNVGCVPSKCLIRSSRVAAEIERSEEYGIRSSGKANVDFPKVMERMRKLRADISNNDSATRYTDLGVDVFLGNARFRDSETVDVDGKALRFKKAVIATGARAVDLPIPGLKEAGYLTNETVFTLTDQPRRLAVIGAGPIGCELAQTFRRLGSEVILLQDNEHILNREDADAAEIVQNVFIRERIDLVLGCSTEKVGRRNGSKVLTVGCGNQKREIEVDEILVGVGRAPNVEGLNLEGIGIEFDKRKGVIVDDTLRTANPKIYAVGDICMRWKFTHAADAAARIVIQNALFPTPKKKLSALTMPWTTFTDPEIAHVGMYPRDADSQGIPIDTYKTELDDVDRAIADGETEGFVKVHVRKGTDKIVGATIVASHAGEMISEITLAMVGNVGLGTISGVIHPYPTQAEGIKRVADAYNRTRLTPGRKNLLAKWLQWTR